MHRYIHSAFSIFIIVLDNHKQFDRRKKAVKIQKGDQIVSFRTIESNKKSKIAPLLQRSEVVGQGTGRVSYTSRRRDKGGWGGRPIATRVRLTSGGPHWLCCRSCTCNPPRLRVLPIPPHISYGTSGYSSHTAPSTPEAERNQSKNIQTHSHTRAISIYTPT